MKKKQGAKSAVKIWLLLILTAMALQGCKSREADKQTKEPETVQETGSSEMTEAPAKETADKDPQETEKTALPSETAGSNDEDLAAPSKCGSLHVEGTKLMDKNGQPVQLRGISTHGLSWFPQYVNEDCFAQLRRDWKANVVRLAMYTAESGGYCTDGDREKLKKLVEDGVSYAEAQDLYVIIDWHVLSEGDPNTYLAEAKEFFAEMSARYKDSDNVLYEICNEPTGGATWQQVKSYAEQVIPVIRENDPDSVIIIGTPNWSQDVDQAAADPITGYDNLMYALHFYAATHKEDLRNRMTAAVEAGLPIFVSEYGICDASGSGAIDEQQAALWVQTMDQYGISYIMWNLSNKEETSSVLKSSCEKTSGFTAEDLSPAGQWLYGLLTGQAEGFETGQAESAAGPETGTAGGFILESGGMEITVVLKNSWEADGQPVYQYDLTLKNISGSDCTQWAVDVPFEGAFSVTDGWNGNYTARGNVLHITSREYNGAVAAGDLVKDVGFIVSKNRIAQD